MLSNIPEEKINKIVNLLDAHKGDYTKVAKAANVGKILVYHVDVVHNKRFNRTEKGLGPENLQKYIIATREADDGIGWNNDDPKIKKARELYDEGVIEMATGRDGMNLLLYAIPRQFKDEGREPYFYPVEELQTNVVKLGV